MRRAPIAVHFFTDGSFTAAIHRDVYARHSSSGSALPSLADALLQDLQSCGVVTAAALSRVGDARRGANLFQFGEDVRDDDGAYVRCTLRVTDSRIAADLHAEVARRTFLSLLSCRIELSGVTPADAPAVLAQRQRQLARMNMDEALWDTAQVLMESAFPDDTLSVPQLAEQFASVVRYASLFANDGAASPLAAALCALFRCGVTQDELRGLANHRGSRYVRCVAMFYARFVCAPEELAPYFIPSLGDSGIVSCSEDNLNARALKDVARDLLLDQEDVDLPSLHTWWIERVIEPMLHEAAQLRAAATVATTATASGKGRSKEGAGKSSTLGFASAVELAQFVARARMLERAGRAGALIDAAVADDERTAEKPAAKAERKRTRTDQKPAAHAVMPNVRRIAATQAHRVLLGLLGRREPLRADDDVYLEF